MRDHIGHCHCGRVEFSMTSDLADPVCCNCSFCSRRGAVLQKVPAAQFRLIKGDESLCRYGERSFSDHYFCKFCGIHTFTKSTRNNEDAIVINLGCLTDIDPGNMTPRIFDGATLL